MKIGKAIAFLRKQQGYTQKALADTLGISDKAVSKWERGLGIPDVSLLARLSILLDTDIESLLDGNVSHHNQQWCGVLIIDQDENDQIYAGTMIYDKPIVYFLLSYFMLVGIKDILILTTEFSKNYIEKRLNNGKDYGINIKCIDTNGKDNKLHKGLVVTEFINGRGAMFIKGFNFAYGLDFTKFMQRAMARVDAATVFCVPFKTEKDSEKISYNNQAIIIKDGTEEVVESIDEYYLTSIAFVPGYLINRQEDDAFELRTLLNSLIAKEKLVAGMIGRGFIFASLHDEESINNASQITRCVQILNKCQLADLREVAIRRGLSDDIA